LAIYIKILRIYYAYLDNFGVNIYGDELGELVTKLASQEHGEKTCSSTKNKDSNLGLFSNTL
jgi:hypothetical protein